MLLTVHGLFPVVVFLCLNILAERDFDQQGHFTNDFAVEIDGDSNVADLVASTHGFSVVRHVSSLGSVFHFKTDRVSRRSKRSAINLIDQLNRDPSVVWVEQQRILSRQKRTVVHDKQRELEIRRVDDKSIYQRYSDHDQRLSSKDRIPGLDDRDLGDVGFNDPYFKDQWYLINRGQTGGIPGYDLNVLPVWQKGITGRGVVVSILDDGIDHLHPDLRFNYDPKASADLNDRKDVNNDPMPNATDPSNSHGTRCAGEVAAQANNSNCGVGIAYNSRIGGVRMLDGVVTDLLEAEAILFNNQYVDIYSASWGPTDDGKTLEGPHRYCSKALKDGVTKGRGGKGSIFVWATGNGGSVGDDCSCDGYVSSIYTLSLGCVSDHGLSTYYSEVCPSTMAVVFTGGSHAKPGMENYSSPKIKVVTTDLNGDCTLEFQGTSSAAPLGAGCIALVLEANDNLTWRDVQHIVVETARIPNDKEGGWTVNGAGYHVNHHFGFGVLDCAKMVEVAQTWKNVPEQHVCDVSANNNPVRIYAGGNVNQSLVSNGCSLQSTSAIDHLEHVQVHVRIQHERRGDLSILLISPSGTKSDILSERRLDSSKDGINFTFMTVHNWGENPSGRWTLVVQDKPSSGEVTFGSQRGILESWSLTLYGTVGPLENHHGSPTDYKKDPVRDHFANVNKKNSDHAHEVDRDEIKDLMAEETVSSDSVKIVSKDGGRSDSGRKVARGPGQKQDYYENNKAFEYLKKYFHLEDKTRNQETGQQLKRIFETRLEEDESERPWSKEDGPNSFDGGIHSRGHGHEDPDLDMTPDDLQMLEEVIRELEGILKEEK